MRPFALLALLVALAAPAGAAQQPIAQKPKLVLDLWDVAYLQGSRAGYVHTYVHELEEDGAKLFRATMELRLTVQRSGETITLGMDSGTYETPEGKVVGTFLKHSLGTARTLEITGVVEGDLIRLTLDKTKSLRPAPWNHEVIGLFGQQRLFQERDVKPGTEFSYRTFEPSVNLVIQTKVAAKDFEEVELFAGKQRRRLLRVESQAERIQNVQLPTLVSWLGDDLKPVRAQADIPPFGRVTLYRTTRAVALSTEAVAKLTDIGISQYVKLSRRIPNPYEATAVLYRVTVRDEADPASVFARDERQQVKKTLGKSIELEVREKGGQRDDGKRPTSEYTQSSYFITSDDARVRSLAERAVGTETDPWRKALRIERWVHLNMKVTSDEALAPADHVARTLRGDCTEFAMLTAAMCRAAGVPSRTAVGLVYADLSTGPIFAFHMWTEVLVQGKWLGVDATLGKGHVGATHLKIQDQSWHDVYDQSPLLPIFRVLGRLSIEVVRTEGR